jgi:predicted choloylglycine hydrolase/tetratricopeptide (TPR) repeat protein
MQKRKRSDTNWLITFVVCNIFLVLFSAWGITANAQELPSVYREGSKIIAGNGYLLDYGDLKFMYLQGSPFEMGVQQGLLITHDQDALKYRASAEQLYNPLSGEYPGLKKLEVTFKQFYFDTKLLPTIKRNIPDEYLEEMQGIAFGLSRGVEPVDFNSVLMANVYLDLGAHYACTSFAVFNEATVGESLLHGRNLDSPGMESLAQLGYVAVFNPDQGYPFITHIYPLSSGIMQGMNTAGISVSMNWSSVQPSEKSLDGMPFTFLLRSIVQYAGSIDEAVEIIKKVPLTMGLNILISDSKTNQAVVVEATGERYVLRTGSDYVYAANRFLHDYLKPFQEEGWLASDFREKRLMQLIQNYYGKISPIEAAEILRDKSPQFVPGLNHSSSILTVIFQPEDGRMFVSMLDDERSAPDRELLAFSLPNALEGANPLLEEESIPATNQDAFFQAWTIMRQAELQYRSSQLEEVLSTLDKLDANYAVTERALFLKGHVLARLNRLEESERHLSVLVQKPSIAEPYHLLQGWALLGVIYDTWGQRTKAVECYSEALKHKVDDLSGNSNAFYRLAVVGLQKPLKWDHDLSKNILPTTDEIEVFSEDLTIYEGALVRDVHVLGAHRTDPSLIQHLVGIYPGDTLSVRDMQRGERRIKNLQALDTVRIVVVPADPETVDVVVRISEPFGFYFDPVELLVNGVLDFQQERVALNYYNYAGSLINVGGAISWGPNKQRNLSVSFPLGTAAQKLAYNRGHIGNEVIWGSYSGQTFLIDRETWSSNTTWALNSLTNVTLGLSKVTHKVIEQQPEPGITGDGQYINVAIQLLSSGTPTPSLRWQVDGKISTLLPIEDLFNHHWLWSAHLGAVRNFKGGFSLAVDIETKGVSPMTPFEYWPALGGNGQLGAVSPVFVGQSCLYGKAELRNNLTNTWQLAVSWDVGKVHMEPNILSSISGMIRYRTPIGITIEGGYSHSLTTEHRGWRFGIGSAY